jgi:hypothetical protein
MDTGRLHTLHYEIAARPCCTQVRSQLSEVVPRETRLPVLIVSAIKVNAHIHTHIYIHTSILGYRDA